MTQKTRSRTKISQFIREGYVNLAAAYSLIGQTSKERELTEDEVSAWHKILDAVLWIEDAWNAWDDEETVH